METYLPANKAAKRLRKQSCTNGCASFLNLLEPTIERNQYSHKSQDVVKREVKSKGIIFFVAFRDLDRRTAINQSSVRPFSYALNADQEGPQPYM